MYPLLWDENYNKKASYYALITTLEGFSRSDSAVTTRLQNRANRDYLYLGAVNVGLTTTALLASLLYTAW